MFMKIKPDLNKCWIVISFFWHAFFSFEQSGDFEMYWEFNVYFIYKNVLCCPRIEWQKM